MLRLRIHYAAIGEHVHAVVYSSNSEHGTFDHNGTLIFSDREWPQYMDMMAKVKSIKFVDTLSEIGETLPR